MTQVHAVSRFFHAHVVVELSYGASVVVDISHLVLTCTSAGIAVIIDMDVYAYVSPVPPAHPPSRPALHLR